MMYYVSIKIREIVYAVSLLCFYPTELENKMVTTEDDGTIKLNDADAQEELRRIDQLSSCPCSNCESRCWTTGEITECRKYRKWFDRQHGINRRTYKRRNT